MGLSDIHTNFGLVLLNDFIIIYLGLVLLKENVSLEVWVRSSCKQFNYILNDQKECQAETRTLNSVP